MSLPAPMVPVGFSLSAVLCWGTSDFAGGYAARRANTFILTTIVHGSGALLMTAIVLLTHAPMPTHTSLLWSVAAGLSGGAALAIFYRALADAGMGLAAPVSAVLAAAIPTAFAILTEGSPGALPIIGFVLAAAGIWLISRSNAQVHSRGLGLAVLAGFGFAGYFLFTKQAGEGSALWIALVARLASLAITGVIVLFLRSRIIAASSVALAVFAGFLDISGSVVFVRATQTGRLDVAVVISSLYPALTVLLARLILNERFTRWKLVGMLTCLLAVPMIAS